MSSCPCLDYRLLETLFEPRYFNLNRDLKTGSACNFSNSPMGMLACGFLSVAMIIFSLRSFCVVRLTTCPSASTINARWRTARWRAVVVCLQQSYSPGCEPAPAPLVGQNTPSYCGSTLRPPAPSRRSCCREGGELRRRELSSLLRWCPDVGRQNRSEYQNEIHQFPKWEKT